MTKEEVEYKSGKFLAAFYLWFAVTITSMSVFASLFVAYARNPAPCNSIWEPPLRASFMLVSICLIVILGWSKK